MPNPRKAFPDNSPGAWYVDDNCVCCGLCENMAPALFRMAADSGNFLVARQPASAEELVDAEDALERCPAEAIGNDRITASAPLP